MGSGEGLLAETARCDLNDHNAGSDGFGPDFEADLWRKFGKESEHGLRYLSSRFNKILSRNILHRTKSTRKRAVV